jgi:hypothetical protein
MMQSRTLVFLVALVTLSVMLAAPAFAGQDLAWRSQNPTAT